MVQRRRVWHSEYVEGIFLKKFVTRSRPQTGRRFIKAKEFAAWMAVHPDTVKRWIKAGKLDDQGLVRGGLTTLLIRRSARC
jgi:hypothetical protein